jgi:hypothetical protein
MTIETRKINNPIEDLIDGLIRGPQYALPQAEKERALLPILRERCRDMAPRCPPYARFLSRLGCDPDDWQSLADIPPLPAAMFKKFLLSAVPPEQVLRELRSSSTTGADPSRIAIDKTTAFRQSRALASILKEHIGGARRPFLVLDAEQSAAAGDALTARGAAIRGLANFASESVFGMNVLPSGDLEPDWPRIEAFLAARGGGPLLMFGFTFIVWSRFILQAEARGLQFRLPDCVLLHSGGWKKLVSQAVTKEQFNARASALLGSDRSNILDFYGMVEQVGTVFVDCSGGNKHAPAFADAIIRRSPSLEPAQIGEEGIIEVLSALPSSYPGQALITEDQGVMLGLDDCPCGRKGKYFRFTRRIEQAEIRGCGDTFAQTREIR